MRSQSFQNLSFRRLAPASFGSIPLLLAAFMFCAVFAALDGPAKADPDPLSGAWSGGGIVTFASGNRERARCRVYYRAESATTYVGSGTCATESGQATQTVILRRVGANHFQGTFHNAEYNLNGSVYISLHGPHSQTLALRAQGGGHADIHLSR